MAGRGGGAEGGREGGEGGEGGRGRKGTGQGEGTAGGRVVQRSQLQLEYKQSAHRTLFSKDGARALVCSGTTLQGSNEFWLFDVVSGRRLSTFKGHTDSGFFKGVNDVKWSSDEHRAVSGGVDGAVRVWDVALARCTTVLKAGTAVRSVAWWSNDRFVVAGLINGGIEVWDVERGQRVWELKGHFGFIQNLDVRPDQTLLLSASGDTTARLWKLDSDECVHILRGHTGEVYSAVFSHDGQRALTSSGDSTVRLWDLATGRCVRVLEGHTASVHIVAWHLSVSSLAVSGSNDQSVRLWNVDSGACQIELQGHNSGVQWYLHWSPDGQRLTSCDFSGKVISWDLSGILATPTASATDQVQYTNAKVLIVGDSGAGKTGLSKRLALNSFEPSISTVGAWSTRWSLGLAQDATGTGEREIWLWDFGGQHDQRLVHQLFMDDTALAVLVFDGQRDGVLDTLRQWDRDIARASHAGCRKLLVAGRVDAGPPRISREDLVTFAKDNGFQGYFETSAKTGFGCEELKAAIAGVIDWDKIPWRSSPTIFKTLKNAVIDLKDAAVGAAVGRNKVSGDVLRRFDELRDALQSRLRSSTFSDNQLKAVLSLLSGPGVVWELKFGGYYLLHPELVSSYTQGLLQNEPLQLGFAREGDVIAGVLAPSVLRLDNKTKERLLLLEVHHTLLERALCYREVTPDKGPILIFPSCFKTARPAAKSDSPPVVSYTFSGFVDGTYATLVVRLHHADKFGSTQLWEDYAEFGTDINRSVGLLVDRRKHSTEFRVCCSGNVPMQHLIDLCEFVHKHLVEHGHDVVRLRHFTCESCGHPVEDRKAVKVKIDKFLTKRRSGATVAGTIPAKIPTVECVSCDERVTVWDELEEHFVSADFEDRVSALQLHSKQRLAQQSAQRVLVADIISLVLQAGHEVEELLVPELGANLKVTLKPGRAPVMVVLSTFDSLRVSAEASFFGGDALRFSREWASRQLRVVLVLRVPKLRDRGENAGRQDDGEIQWMPLSGLHIDHQQVEFRGRPLDAAAVRGWKDVPTSEVEEGKDVMTRTDPVEPLPWTQRDRRNDVFVSFRGGDPFGTGTVRTTLAEPLAAALRPLAVFFDDHGLDDMMANAPGVTIDGILQGLLSTQGGGVFAVLITPTFFKRKWPTLELAIAYALHEAGQVRLLPFLLGKVTASSVETQPFVQHACKGLKKVHMLAVPAADPQATLTFIKSKVEETAALQRGVAGATAAASFSALKNQIALSLKNDGTSQDILVEALLHRPRGETETLLQALAKSSVTPGDVSKLRDAVALHFTTPDHQSLVQLVDSYQYKWHQTRLSVPVAESVLGEVKGRVEQWWAANPARDVTPDVERSSRQSDGELQWISLSEVRVPHQRVEFRGQRLDVDALRGWGTLASTPAQLAPGVFANPAVAPARGHVQSQRGDASTAAPHASRASRLQATTAVQSSPFEWKWRDRRFDVFLSFRGNEPFDPAQKKATIRTDLARPVAMALRDLRFSVFFDQRTLPDAVADHPDTSIDDILQGLLSTQGGGLVVLLVSATYFEKPWTLIEMAAAHSLFKLGQVRLLIIALDLSPSTITDHDFVKEECPRLEGVPIVKLSDANDGRGVRRTDAAAVRAFIVERATHYFGPPASVGEDRTTSYTNLLIAIADALEHDGHAMGKLLAKLKVHRHAGESGIDALRRAPGLSETTAAERLRPLFLQHFSGTAYAALATAVERYEAKWLAPWATAAPAVDLGELKRRVEAWIARTTGKRARFD